MDDLNFKVSNKKPQANQNKDSLDGLSMDTRTDFPIHSSLGALRNDTDAELESEESDESWVAGSGEAAFFLIDMHPDLGDPIEQFGMEIEEDPSDNFTDFVQRFGEKLLWDKGVNVTELEEEDLRCGGLVLRHNITITEERLRELAEDCMVQKCEFIHGGPAICPSDYNESDDKTFWIYFLLRFLGTMMLSGRFTNFIFEASLDFN